MKILKVIITILQKTLTWQIDLCQISLLTPQETGYTGLKNHGATCCWAALGRISRINSRWIVFFSWRIYGIFFEIYGNMRGLNLWNISGFMV